KPRYAEWPFSQGAQQLVFSKRGDDLFWCAFLLYAGQEMLVALPGILKHGLILFPTLQGFFLDIRKRTVKDSARGMPIAPIYRRRKLTNAGITPEAVTFLQQTQAIAQRACQRGAIPFKRAAGQTRQ